MWLLANSRTLQTGRFQLALRYLPRIRVSTSGRRSLSSADGPEKYSLRPSRRKRAQGGLRRGKSGGEEGSGRTGMMRSLALRYGA